ncbi:DUF4407 domain-containing protein [Micromonospora rifamycinica]|uniref:DUF4407 domain-containing protein n=1 Tax=Micromonospora rifamycinica TaxID=291594 RepID=UPI002E2E5710|nr:DUF4407 domain-containing protein [Micromonospora rifamycinica]
MTTKMWSRTNQPAGRNPLTWFFLWCSGVDRNLIDTRVERFRYVGVGVFIVLIASVAGVMFTLFGTVINGGFTPLLLPFAAGWALLVFWADRSIVAEPRYGDLDPGRPGTWRKRLGPHLFQYLFRVAIAVGSALLVTEAALLLMFQPEIRREMDAARIEQVAAVQAVDRHGETRQVAELRSRIEANDEQVADAEERVATAADKMSGEIGGATGTRRPGYGPIAAARERELEQLRKSANATRTRVDKENKALRDQIGTLENGRQSRISASVEAIEQDRGWITQEKALQRFLKANRDSWMVQWIPWVLRVTFLAIDLLPVSLKLFARPTLYDRRLRAQASVVAYRTAQKRQVERDAVDQALDLERIRANTRYDLTREEESFRKSSRLGYLRDDRW